MLTRLNRIRKLGLVFADFSWSQSAPDFRPINLIYGWNGCGKTTLTRLFDEVTAPTDSGVEYELLAADGATLRSGEAFPWQVRVFNQDYIGRNVKILEASANTISILLGEENKDLVDQILADEKLLNGDPATPETPGMVKFFNDRTQQKRRKEKENETAFSDIARTIGAVVAGSGMASRTYRSPNAKADFDALTDNKPLSESDLDRRLLALKQDALPDVPVVELPSFTYDGTSYSFDQAVEKILADASAVCATTVESEAIARLTEHPDISDWVEQGRALHDTHGSAACEYCGGPMSAERIAQLAKHFSDSDRMLKQQIDTVEERIREVSDAISRLAACDTARLYKELQADFDTHAEQLRTAQRTFQEQAIAVAATLRNKRSRTNAIQPFNLVVNTDGVVQTVEAINAPLRAHNDKSRDFQTVKDAALQDVKAHYLSIIAEEVNGRNAQIATFGEELEKAAAEIREIRQRIAAAREAVSSNHKACEQINENLKTFLGRNELRFEPDTQTVDDGAGGQKEVVTGYRIVRAGKPVTYLSEGEKTAIAFVYFVVHLNDGQFPRAEGIVVIDDPISSLDSNSLYQAFAFLKGAVTDCRQVFVLTHNFEFLKLLLNWRSGARMRHTSYYMIRNHLVGDERRATIDPMDKELKDYESEYHYLFKRLKEMRAEQDGTIMRAYPVPNIARKVWEAFLLYRVPNGGTPYAKMEKLKEARFDAQKLDAIYKFTNDQSHITGSGFDPALVPETQKVLSELFEMMETIAPEHYKILDDATPLA